MDIQRGHRGFEINGKDTSEFWELLARLAYQEFLRSKSKNVLDYAVRFSQESVSVAHDNDISLPRKLIYLSALRSCRYTREGMVADVEGAVKMARRALQLSVHNVSALTSLSDVLHLRFKRNENRADLEEAIMLMRQAINLTPPDEPKQAVFLASLGFNLSHRYKLLDDIADLEEAIKVTRQAVNSTANGDDIWATWVSDLSHQLTCRYARTREVADLEEAVITARRSVNSVSRNFRYRTAMLDSLGGALSNRHTRTGDLTDINEAITVTRQAIDTMPAPLDHADRWMYLNNLGQRLLSRYKRVGEMTDLEEAITVTRQAVSLRPLNHDNQSNPMHDLGGLLALRYERIGFLVDLNEAIVVMRKAIDSMPLITSAESGAFRSLGAALCCRFGRTAVMADIEDAINALRQEIGLLQSQGVRSSSLTTLGNALWRRYKKKGDAANLEEAITVTRQAVDSTPYDDYERIVHLNNLGIMLQDKHKQTAKITYLEEAIMVTKQGVNAARQDDPTRAACIFNLGALFRCQFLVTRDEAHLNEALSCLQGAWECQTATPLHRVNAASRCLLPLSLQGKLDIASQLGKDIINLLPTVNTKMLDRADQLAVLTGFAGVAADTCALLLAVNQSAEAIYYLENGRANIIGQLVDARSDLSTMAHQYPDLARRYERLRNEVNTPITGLEQNSTLVWQQRCKTIANLDACITKIRNTPGQERFQLGQTTAEIQECAAGGTIVIVNIAGFRSDAIVVSTGGIQTLNLPKLSAIDASDWLDRKWTGRRWERARKNKEYLEYLAWLWEACVKPIIDEVDNGRGTVDGLPRIWWIGTGLASSMPFHAAGKHFPGSIENALSRAISSYTPSIKALGYSRYRARSADPKGGTLLFTTMPTTPGNDQGLGQNSHKPPGLPGVKEEKKQVIGAAGNHLNIELLDLPSVGQVVDSLENCCIAHFACHGYTDHSDPSNSGLILQKCMGGQDKQDRLTVRRVSELRLEKAQVAYLSACSTAENRWGELSDEVLHVVSGFQMAGFPHVVGCLWPSIDSVCVEVASEFYSSMLGNGIEGLVRKGGVASALRDAVLKVREENIGSPLLWAPFVHYGA
ncbi:hypothetical protein V495_04960 [Pseudogymnoascus sp. VKM F-4514 (FW-929)]|nr:hypothetical protein V495_04960 [Pseudogymnoascus sp. VKM F-4514 (FW-929)]KFY67249.1 hypothetical protein V497_00486 [Pseudogymnoascus sp. VKM F-4516 (FW-969)]